VPSNFSIIHFHHYCPYFLLSFSRVPPSPDVTVHASLPFQPSSIKFLASVYKMKVLFCNEWDTNADISRIIHTSIEHARSQALASYCGTSGWIPDDFIWGIWWTQWHRSMLVFECLQFSPANLYWNIAVHSSDTDPWQVWYSLLNSTLFHSRFFTLEISSLWLGTRFVTEQGSWSLI
jgi:hypothetical protein